jgi:hypothetical protein
MLEVFEDSLGRFPARPAEIVLTGVEHDRPGTIGEDDPLSVVSDMRQVATAEAPVQHAQRDHVLLKSVPESDGRAAREEDRTLGWGRAPVGILECANLGLPELGSLDPGQLNGRRSETHQDEGSREEHRNHWRARLRLDAFNPLR